MHYPHEWETFTLELEDRLRANGGVITAEMVRIYRDFVGIGAWEAKKHIQLLWKETHNKGNILDRQD